MAVLGTTKNKRTPEEIERLRIEMSAELKEIVGARWVSADPAVLDTHAWQYLSEFITGGEKYLPRPLAVVLPKDTQEVAEVVKLCNRMGVQYKPFSTGFGSWAGVMSEDVLQIDLRRLDRTIKIDKENMYAVVEPYVTGNQLQTDAMKVGLNTHIIGAGAQTSILASATSMMGQSWDGVSMGFSDRNLLGVEWVTPEGEIAQIGSFDANGEYFSGDGPGPSLRGVFRGFGGAFGGLGVFTKAAVKLYPWKGPKKLEQRGTSPVYFTEIPENHFTGILLVNNWKDMAELAYRLGESEICDCIGRNAPALIAAVITVDNNEMLDAYSIPLMQNMHYCYMVTMFAEDEDDLAYRKKVMKKIMKDLDGGMIMSGAGPDVAYWMFRLLKTMNRRIGLIKTIKSIIGLNKLVMKWSKQYGLKDGANFLNNIGYQSLLRSNMNMRGAFRFGGSFHTSMGALVGIDTAIRGAKVGEQIKRKYIDKKIIFDDGADNAWGGLYEGGAYAHLEELAMYDPTDEYCREHLADFVVETNMASIEHICGDAINACSPAAHIMYSPNCYNYDNWQQKIKATLDPKNASDASFYTDPEFEKNPPEDAAKVLFRVAGDRAKIEID